MTAKMYFDLSWLRFEGKGTVVLNDNFIVLSNDENVRQQYCTGKLIYEYGSSITRYSGDGVFAYSNFNLSDGGIISPEQFQSEYVNEFNFRSQHLKSFLSFLWFEKDNSVGLYGTYGQIPDMKIVNGKSRSLVTYLHDGSTKEVYFTKEEIKRVSDLTNVYAEMRGVTDTKDFNTNVLYEYNDLNQSSKGIFPKTHPEFQYNKSNAIDRAIHFLMAARVQDFLFYKIAYYMPIFECLFSTKDTDITFRISLWAACYLTKDPKERDVAKTDIVKGYDIRSRFIHGQSSTDTSYEKLKPLAERIDKYIRIILKRAIEVDSVIFNKYPTTDKEKYFNSLVIGTEFEHEPIIKKINEAELNRQNEKERLKNKQTRTEAQKKK